MDTEIEHPEPTLDDDGLLRHAGHWVAIPDTQLPVVELMVRSPGRLVRNVDIEEAYRSGGGTVTKGALRSLIHRLRARLTAVGLDLYVIRDRGVMLDVATDESARRRTRH